MFLSLSFFLPSLSLKIISKILRERERERQGERERERWASNNNVLCKVETSATHQKTNSSRWGRSLHETGNAALSGDLKVVVGEASQACARRCELSKPEEQQRKSLAEGQCVVRSRSTGAPVAGE